MAVMSLALRADHTRAMARPAMTRLVLRRPGVPARVR
jgi:hypothetical protein